ncbi:MAG: Purine nucleoside phosphoramidase [Phycisphaerae bacterium]|nr:Purine nucleoside phosphoramidase [Phycisphaerae bacterium]
MSDDCLFCKIIAGKIPGRKVYEDDAVYAFEDINPQAPTHVLIVPRRHVATINDLGDGDAELAGRLVLVARRIAAGRGLAESGYRLVYNCQAGAGQTVFHVHLHLLGGRNFTWPPG